MSVTDVVDLVNAPNPGWLALFQLLIMLAGIVIAWYSLQVVRWEVFLKDAKSRPAAVLRLLLAILIGYELSRFAGDYLLHSLSIRQIF
jgi:uncharacterized integral membrane protein (TIGR02327 family)